jgi:hypothetical protein
MGCLCRTFREEPLPRPCISFAEPSIKPHPTTLGRNRHEGSRAPPWAPPTRETLGGVLVLAKDKPLSGTRLTARTLGGRARNGRRERALRLLRR